MITQTKKYVRLRQRGAATVVIAVLFLAIIGVALAVTLQSAGSNFADVSAHGDSVNALFLAESGVERALYRATANIPCASLARDPVSGNRAFGGGGFAILKATVFGSDQCDIEAAGYVGLAVRTISARIKYNPGAPLNEPFSYVDANHFNTFWGTEVLVFNSGTSGFDAAYNCANPPCVNTVAGSGSFYAQTTLNSPGAKLEGYRELNLALPFSTTAANTDINYSVGFRKNSRAGNPNAAVVAIDVVDSAGTATRIWTDSAFSAGTEFYISGIFALPIGKTFVKVRIYFNLRETTQGMAQRQITLHVDDLRITRLGAAASLVNWGEIYPLP